MFIQRVLQLTAAFCFVLSAQTALAQAKPEAVVNEATSNLLKLARAEQQLLDTNPDQYFTKVRALLDPIVDFKFIAKQVMGRKHWPNATETQREQFAEVFTESLVQTFGKAIGQFADFEAEAKLQKMDDSGNNAWVIQVLKGGDNNSKIAYLMRKNGDTWKAVNVILDGSKLLDTFKNQFDGAVERYEGIDGAIANWSGESDKG